MNTKFGDRKVENVAENRKRLGARATKHRGSMENDKRVWKGRKIVKKKTVVIRKMSNELFS